MEQYLGDILDLVVNDTGAQRFTGWTRTKHLKKLKANLADLGQVSSIFQLMSSGKLKIVTIYETGGNAGGGRLVREYTSQDRILVLIWRSSLSIRIQPL